MFTSGQYRILSMISVAGSISRTDLVKMTGLSKGTISALTRELLDRNIVCERELVFGQGRPAVLLGLNAQAACFAGISLQSDPGHVILSDLHGTILARTTIPRVANTDACVEHIEAGIRKLLKETGSTAGPLRGVGIALPGFVGKDSKTCLRSTVIGWKNVDIATPLAQRLDNVVLVENDANALIQGEHLFGIMRDCPDFSLIVVGDGGIGCAHIVDGKLHRGHNGGAGEISHTTAVGPNGLEQARPCSCGKRGCLDTVSSLQAVRSFAQQYGLPDNPAELEALAQNGQADALSILHTAGSAMGMAVAQLVQLFDPSQVLVILDKSFIDGVFGAALRQTMEVHIMPRPNWTTTLTLRAVSTDAWAKGAAGIATRQFLFGGENTV